MPSNEFDQILRKTLDDDRLSRGERHVLRSTLKELNPDAQQLALMRHQVFAIAREEIISPDAYGVLDWLEDAIKVLGDPPAANNQQAPAVARAWFSPADDCVRAIKSELTRAQHRIDICVFTITDNRITDSILQRHRSGVKVRIITDNDKAGDLGSDIERMESSGIEIRMDRSSDHMHHKFAMFDDATLMTGSFNWTRSAAERNQENLIVTQDETLVQAFAGEFKQLWERFG